MTKMLPHPDRPSELTFENAQKISVLENEIKHVNEALKRIEGNHLLHINDELRRFSDKLDGFKDDFGKKVGSLYGEITSLKTTDAERKPAYTRGEKIIDVIIQAVLLAILGLVLINAK